jgi:hypothetical protein
MAALLRDYKDLFFRFAVPFLTIFINLLHINLLHIKLLHIMTSTKVETLPEGIETRLFINGEVE